MFSESNKITSYSNLQTFCFYDLFFFVLFSKFVVEWILTYLTQTQFFTLRRHGGLKQVKHDMDSMDSNLIALIFLKQIHQNCNDSQEMRHLFLPQHFSISACHGIYNRSKRLKLELQIPAWLVPLCGACLGIPKIFGS